jgi:murein L,D-transpeptidase YafK
MLTKSWKVLGLITATTLVLGGAVLMALSQNSRTAGSVQSLKLPLINPRIVVLKSKRQLLLYSDEKLVRRYSMGLGFNPVDDKSKEGDGATPEGTFYVFTRNEQSKYYLSLGVSYPNVEDAERGLRDKLITPGEYEEILKANRDRVVPPQNTPLGGLIYIHGHGSQSDWTQGCVALDDENMKELFDAVPVGTEVVIEP